MRTRPIPRVRTSTARHRRDEHHAVALPKRPAPVAELAVDRHAQHLAAECERIARRELGVQLLRRAGRALERFLAPSGLLAQQCKVLHRQLPHPSSWLVVHIAHHPLLTAPYSCGVLMLSSARGLGSSSSSVSTPPRKRRGQVLPAAT